jgi:hypothetical protein
MHCQQGGEVWAWNGLLDAFRWFSGGFQPFLGYVVHRSDRSRSPVWQVRVLVLCTCWAPVWPVVVTGLTGVSWSCCSCPVLKWFACIRPGEVLFAFVWLSIACWSFFLFVSFLFLFSLVTLCGCCQCTHQGEDWGPYVVRGPVDGRFLMWWVIDNVVWTNSWLSIAGAGCGLTGVGVGEEQARKVVAREASKYGEDK